jgi:hypothetical protein
MYIGLAGGVDVLFVYGLMFGPNALATHPEYRPEYSLARAYAFQRLQFADILFLPGLAPAAIIAFWAIFSFIAWRSRDHVLRFCLLFMLITPLPIEVLEHRGGAALWAPLFGWAIVFARVFVGAARGMAGVAARIVPRFRHAGGLALTLVIAAGVSYWASESRWRQVSYVRPAMLDCGAQTWDVIQKVKRLNLQAAPNTTIAFLDDPLHDWQMEFIAELWLRDRSVTVWVESKNPHSPRELSHADHIYDYRNGQFFEVR